jgi:hypothetical protein
MKQVTIVWLCCLSLCIGLVYFGIQKQIIIVRVPPYTSTAGQSEGQSQSKRNIMLYYWCQGAFKQESIAVIDAASQADTLHYIVTNWLTLVEQTSVLNKKVSLESVMLSTAHDAYISFDHSIFMKNESTYEKWMRVEGLLKTIRTANMGINRVCLHVRHSPLADAHLDFSRGWPVHGFMGG